MQGEAGCRREIGAEQTLHTCLWNCLCKCLGVVHVCAFGVSIVICKGLRRNGDWIGECDGMEVDEIGKDKGRHLAIVVS